MSSEFKQIMETMIKFQKQTCGNFAYLNDDIDEIRGCLNKIKETIKTDTGVNQMNVAGIKELITAQKNSRKDLKEKIAAIEADKMLSDYAKKQKIENARKLYNVDTTSNGRILADQLLEYKKNSRGLDLTDPALTNFISIVGMLGANTPRIIIDECVTHFKGKQEVLKTIEGVLKAKEVPYSDITRFIIDDEALDAAIIEAQRNFDNVSELSKVGIAALMIEGVENATIEPQAVQPSGIPTIF